MGTAFDGRLYNADALGALDGLYDQFGSALVHALDGPFALAARSGAGGLLARDRFGERPLYWRPADDGSIVFASRLGDLAGRAAGELEPRAVSAHLAGEPLPQSLTFVRGVFELPPGHVMDVRDDGRHIQRWWSPPAGGGGVVEASPGGRAGLRGRRAEASSSSHPRRCARSSVPGWRRQSRGSPGAGHASCSTEASSRSSWPTWPRSASPSRSRSSTSRTLTSRTPQRRSWRPRCS